MTNIFNESNLANIIVIFILLFDILQKYVELTLPHTADIEDGDIDDTDLAIRSRGNIGDQWNIDGQVKVLRYSNGSITLAISHFTGFGLSLKVYYVISYSIVTVLSPEF